MVERRLACGRYRDRHPDSPQVYFLLVAFCFISKKEDIALSEVHLQFIILLSLLVAARGDFGG